jgi:hypothetical protein
VLIIGLSFTISSLVTILVILETYYRLEQEAKENKKNKKV